MAVMNAICIDRLCGGVFDGKANNIEKKDEENDTKHDVCASNICSFAA